MSGLREALQRASEAEQHDGDHLWTELAFRKKVVARVPDRWLVPGTNGLRYILVEPQAAAAAASDNRDDLLVYEPENTSDPIVWFYSVEIESEA